MFDSRKFLYSSFIFLFSLFVIIHSNTLIFQILYKEVLIAFDCLLLIKWLYWHRYSFACFIVKIILLEVTSLFLPPTTDKTQWFTLLKFNLTLQLINGIWSDLRKLLRYFNDTVIVVFLKISFALSATVFPNNMALYSNDLN